MQLFQNAGHTGCQAVVEQDGAGSKSFRPRRYWLRISGSSVMLSPSGRLSATGALTSLLSEAQAHIQARRVEDAGRAGGLLVKLLWMSLSGTSSRFLASGRFSMAAIAACTARGSISG